MKCAEYYIENHKIEVYNSSFGKERILLNGNEISKKKSVFGKHHQFKIKNNEYTIRPKLSITEPQGRYFEVCKNGTPLTLVNFTTQNSRGLLYLLVFIGLGIGYLLGIYLFDVLGF
ncbi:hypothetical protein [uncultured Kriegella sp.]|uniref:hypothetical protein n=1 Tax=uncultured Kriegella sp. TaxID=1798910 RepID=UPI0030DAC7F3|tara:strand:- start:29971 stop:30318 length:348 start_codon:yes stop_codon:yes gene_type:complete